MPLALKITRDPRLPLRLRKKLGKVTRIPENFDFSIDVFGRHYLGRTDTHMDRKIYQYGLHEPSTIRLIRKLLRYCREQGRPPVYVDIGCNSGLHMLAVADLVNAAYGFEPWDAARQHAENNFRQNNLGHMHLYPYGLSDRDALLPFQVPQEGNPGSGKFLKDPTPGALSLEVHSGDAVLQHQNITPGVIKIDVEGHEKRVLNGLVNTIRKFRPFVIFESGGSSTRDFRTDKTLSAVFDPGYFYYGICKSREYPVLRPFNPWKKWENILASPVLFENIKVQTSGN